ncbi:hypothetical protein FNJ88_06265 [Chryseobacterium sp. SNU WT5]|uniref:hypothetical protein n=1 Tax=Chryseobacterium sp. SNU WT5 TaxID=2594269 RepID=UPI00117C808D|nr:hypothetical protein [Chryseobacterium sp. SNU WT5]QDP85186.1 hypothetical protein FNJ88_06265 [Chryseobacterium sp. SNU WT5]
MWFSINWKIFALSLLPPYLRSMTVQSWILLLVSAVETLHYEWLQYRAGNIYKLAHNSQKCYLRGALNDRFDRELRRIRIDDGNAFKRKYIYTDGEEKPKYLGTIFLYDDSDYSDTGVDFIVIVPGDLVYSVYEMRALIDFYRLASKRYKIVTE